MHLPILFLTFNELLKVINLEKRLSKEQDIASDANSLLLTFSNILNPLLSVGGSIHHCSLHCLLQTQQGKQT